MPKKKLASVSEDDADYRDYILNLIADPVCRKVKYADLLVNNGFEDSPENGELYAKKQFKRTMGILAAAMQNKIYFNSKSFCFEVFSNFYPCELEIDGRTWKSAEHFYQAAKFSSTLGIQPNVAIYEAICNAETASATKILADNNLGEEERKAWAQSESRYIATARMLNAKYAQGTYPRMILQKTGDLQLIHESKNDLFWGQSRDGLGQNILGKTLMQMRKSNGDCSVEEMLANVAE